MRQANARTIQSAVLEISHGSQFIEQQRLPDQTFTIGRATDNDLVLSDAMVSRRHASIEPNETGHVIIDHTGTERTIVNDKAIYQQSLSDGDRINIGPFTLLYRLQTAAPDEPQQLAFAETLRTLSPAETTLHEDIARAAQNNELNEFQQRLWNVPQQLEQVHSHQQRVEQFLAEAGEILHADRGQIVYPGQRENFIVATAWPSGNKNESPLSATVIRQVLATGQALACLDVGQDRRFSAVESLAHAGARSLLAAPLVIAGRVTATVCFLRERGARYFTEDDLHTLCALNQLAAYSLQSAAYEWQAETPGEQPQRQTDLPYPLVYRSGIMRQVTRQVLRVATTDATVCITGPSGAGKELIAASIHYGSLRSHGPFIKVNCAAIPENLIESELFGHEKGAFTDARNTRKGRFELAHGGTLFLDEIGDMPMPVQTKVLRAIETRNIERVGGTEPINVQVRLIAATHRDLPTMVQENKFREDLWYRLDVVRINVPPLKDRPEDIPLLFRTFAESSAVQLQLAPVHLGPDAVEEMKHYQWPGNVRQVRNLAERLNIFYSGQQISAEIVRHMIGQQAGDTLAEPTPQTTTSTEPESPVEPLRPLAEARADFEREYIRKALAETNGNITRAAEILGLARENLSRKIKQLKIELR